MHRGATPQTPRNGRLWDRHSRTPARFGARAASRRSHQRPTALSPKSRSQPTQRPASACRPHRPYEPRPRWQVGSTRIGGRASLSSSCAAPCGRRPPQPQRLRWARPRLFRARYTRPHPDLDGPWDRRIRPSSRRPDRPPPGAPQCPCKPSTLLWIGSSSSAMFARLQTGLVRFIKPAAGSRLGAAALVKALRSQQGRSHPTSNAARTRHDAHMVNASTPGLFDGPRPLWGNPWDSSTS